MCERPGHLITAVLCLDSVETLLITLCRCFTAGNEIGLPIVANVDGEWQEVTDDNINKVHDRIFFDMTVVAVIDYLAVRARVASRANVRGVVDNKQKKVEDEDEDKDEEEEEESSSSESTPPPKRGVNKKRQKPQARAAAGKKKKPSPSPSKSNLTSGQILSHYKGLVKTLQTEKTDLQKRLALKDKEISALQKQVKELDHKGSSRAAEERKEKYSEGL